jgi:hypothetical protein
MLYLTIGWLVSSRLGDRTITGAERELIAPVRRVVLASGRTGCDTARCIVIVVLT